MKAVKTRQAAAATATTEPANAPSPFPNAPDDLAGEIQRLVKLQFECGNPDEAIAWAAQLPEPVRRRKAFDAAYQSLLQSLAPAALEE